MIALIPFVGSEFLPPMDQGQFSVSIELPQGTVYTKTADITNKVESIIETIPEADTIYTTVGGNALASMVGGMGGSSTNVGSISVTLVPKEQRTRTTDEIAAWVSQQVKNIPGAKITVSSMNDVASGATGGGTASVMGAPISVDIKGDDMDTLAEVADDIKGLVETVPGVTSAATSMGEGAPELRLTIDRYKASQYGLNAATIASTVQSAIKGQLATRYKVEGREIDVTLYGDESYKTDPDKLSQLLIPTMTGGNVPLGELAKVEEAKGPVAINRQDLRRTVSVSVNISDRALGDVTADIQAKINAYKLPSGYAVSYSGQSQMLNDAFSDLGMALILAIILVYMIMAAQFESFIHPFDIMFAVPLAFGGAVFGLFLTGKALSVPAYIGVIMLAGIVVNNAIVLIDYTNQLRDRGYSCEEALIKAGPTRLRPILMTTLTTVLGLIPLALGIGEGAEMEAPMAIVVIFGLGLSTIITLIIVPVIYSLFDRFSRRHHEPVDNIIPIDGREV
jgi:HAE1 family hydrophobic/amphiphilic exporter-1